MRRVTTIDARAGAQLKTLLTAYGWAEQAYRRAAGVTPAPRQRAWLLKRAVVLGMLLAELETLCTELAIELEPTAAWPTRATSWPRGEQRLQDCLQETLHLPLPPRAVDVLRRQWHDLHDVRVGPDQNLEPHAADRSLRV